MAGNTTVLGPNYILTPTGATGDRPTASAGMLRFNTTFNLMEYYDGTSWKAIDSPPTVTSVSGVINTDTNTTLTINGTGFGSGAVVSILGAGVGGVDRNLTTTFVNSTQVTAATNAATVNFTGGGAYDIKVTNASGLSATTAGGNVDRDPTWSTASGSLGTIFDGQRGSVSYSLSASDPDGNTLTFSVVSGAIPTGMSLNTSSGAITGTPNAVGSDTTFSFTIRVSSTSTTGSLTTTVDRAFSITIKAPVITTYTSSSGTFSVPSGLTSLNVLVVAGGGGGGNQHVAGGGAGGLIYRPAMPVSPGGSLSYNIGGGGGGGAANSGAPGPTGQSGGNSVFGTLTANGGGGGGGGFGYTPGQSGGSGGGGGGAGGNQPAAGGDSGTYGFGNPGGSQNGQAGPGGGGAGAAGSPTQGNQGGPGGNGRAYSISGSSVFYAGGGGGGGHQSSGGNRYPGGQGGGGSGGGYQNNPGTDYGEPGTNNRGGGGGGSGGQNAPSGSGGSGIIIVAY